MIDWLLLILRIVVPLLLYTFLGQVLYQLWLKTEDTKQSIAYLRALDDPNQVWQLNSPATLGRHEDNTIVIDDDFISAHHLSLNYKHKAWWLLDLNSTNGTWVNDQAIVNEETCLADNDLISIGNKQYEWQQKN